MHLMFYGILAYFDYVKLYFRIVEKDSTDRIPHRAAFALPVVHHWLEREFRWIENCISYCAVY